jgi:hypothetical protein
MRFGPLACGALFLLGAALILPDPAFAGTLRGAAFTGAKPSFDCAKARACRQMTAAIGVGLMETNE